MPLDDLALPAPAQDETASAELDRLLVSRAIYNTAAEGASESNAFAMAQSDGGFLLAHVPDSPGRYTPSAGYTFSWSDFGGSSELGTRVSRFEFPERGRSTRIEIESSYAHVQTGASLGTFLHNII